MRKQIEKANEQLSRIKIIQRGQSLYVQGTFPPKKGDGEKPKQYQISLKCKATVKELKVAIAKAKLIEGDLILERWQWQEEKKDSLSVAEVIEKYTKDYWQRNKASTNKLYSYKYNQERVYGYLPEDQVFNKQLIVDAIKSLPVGSYTRNEMINFLRPVARFMGINDIDYSQFGKYKKKPKELPKIEDIIKCYQGEKNHRNKWLIRILFTFGLRPHEVFKSEYKFDKVPQTIIVPPNTKTGKRTVYPLIHNEIDVFNLKMPNFKVNLDLPNPRLGKQISKRFIPYPFTAYQLRHYYAVRGAMIGISPVTMSKWMGHSLNEHFKSYASLLGDVESEQLWLNKFSK